MRSAFKAVNARRLVSSLLVLIMLLGMIPAAPHSHALSPSLKITNLEGEESDTFVVGEPIFITAESGISDDWVGFYSSGEANGSSFWFWFYVDGETHNVYETAPWKDGEEANYLPAGNYDVRIEKDGPVLKTITLTEPETKDSSLEVESESVAVGEKIRYRATAFADGGWVGLYSGALTTADSFGSNYIEFKYTNGHNGEWIELDATTEGEFTLVLFGDNGYGAPVKTVSFEVTGSEIDPLTTDKTSYTFGEPIMVTSAFGDPNWIGLYKQDDATPTSAGPTSLFWLYPTAGTPVNILSGEQQRHSEYVAGTYKILLLDGNYGIIASVENIVITAEIESSETVQPTCDDDGYILHTYTDGTTSTEYPEELRATGHDWGDWVFDGDAAKTHTRTCSNDASHTETLSCTFDGGVVTVEPTEGKDGTKTFTCTECGGTYTELIPAKVVDHEKIVTEPTCTEPGSMVYVYTDGTESAEIPLSPKGHSWGEWAHVEGTKTHSRTCANDPAHTETADCTYDDGVLNSGIRTFTCSVCGGTYTETVLATDKAEYDYGEKIYVSSSGSGKDWIGLYKKGETYNPDNGGVKSIFWYYVGEAGNTDVSILDQRNENDRGGEYGPGEFTVVFFTNDSYSALTTVDITVGPAKIIESETVQPTCEEDGYILHTYTDGTTSTEYTEELRATGHDWSDWSFDGAIAKTHTRVCATDASHTETLSCAFDEGVVTLEPTENNDGEKTFTCSECGGTYTEIIPAKTVVGERIVTEPTCTEPGSKVYVYSDGTESAEIPLSPKGHSWGEWVHVEGTKTHSRTCANDSAHVETEDCTEGTKVVSNGVCNVTCSVCGGTWSEPILTTDKTDYIYGEPILVDVNWDLGGLWVGFYKEDDKVGNSDADSSCKKSIFWYYVDDEGKTDVNILATRDENDRGSEYTAGDFKVVLLGGHDYDDYAIQATVHLTVTAELESTKTVEPTCEADGYILYTYTDGTTSTEYTEELRATGHSWGTPVPVENERTHLYTCVNDASHTKTEACTFDDGVVTLEPSNGQMGEKTFTCTLCGGSYTEPYSDQTVVSDEVVKKATCEEDGLRVVTYSDGTSAEIVLPKLGHNWGEWESDGASKTHSRVCANDSTHVETEECEFDGGVVSDGQINYTCAVCGNSYAGSLLVLEKNEFGLGEDIYVTAHTKGEGSWVGIYKQGEVPSTVVSLYWFYVKNSSEGIDRTGEKIKLTDSPFLNMDRNEMLSNGTYNIILFGDSGYSDILATETVTVYTDMSDTKFSVSLDGEILEPGTHKEYELSDIGVTSPLNLFVDVEGAVGASWVGVFREKLSTETNYNGLPYLTFYYLCDQPESGVNLSSKISIETGNYTIVVFEDGTYDKPLQAVTFSVSRPIVSETVITAATCTRPGTMQVVYEDDGDDSTEDTVLVVIPKLGHDMSPWAPVEGTDTHTRSCLREGCKVSETEACAYVDNVCPVCGGQGHVHELTPVEAVKATCTENGNVEYFTCDCGAVFSDPDGLTEISLEDTVIPATDHSWGDWSFDGETAKTHTKTCANDASHTQSEGCTFGDGVIVRQATASVKGLREFTCSVCGGKYTEEFEAASGSYDRIYGPTRYETSIAAADLLKAQLGVEKFSCIVVACGTDFADALSGSYLANMKNAPILLVRSQNTEQIKTYIRENLASGGTVYLLGGTKVIPTSMETGLEGFNVKRLAGATRYETNLAILREAGVAGKDILVCTGKDFADGLSASAVGLPILLVKDSLSAAQAEFLGSSFSGSTLHIIGGTVAVNTRIESALQAYGTVSRISGATRYQTSVNIAATFFSDSTSAVLAYGANFPDGLSGGPVAYRMNAPLILTANGKEAQAVEFATENGIKYGVVLGGAGLISDKTAGKIFSVK